MNIEERKALRMDILSRAYKRHFDPNVKSDRLRLPTVEGAELSDHEVFRAYSYLAEKELIVFKETSADYKIYITAKGIDYIEEHHTATLSADEIQRRTDAADEYNKEVGKMFE